MMTSWPEDLNSTAGAGCASGSAAIAMSAAILGVVFFASGDQPACSRTLTKRSLATEAALEVAASSPKSGASWVQATITSSACPSADWNAPASLRQSWWCTDSGSPALSAAPSALASSATVRLQLQTLSVFPSSVIVFRFGFLFLARNGLRARRFFLLFFLFVLVEDERARLVERRQHLLRNGLAAGPVARIRLERIGHVEVRIAEQLLQRHAAQGVVDLRMHEAGEVRLRREFVHGRKSGCGGFFFCFLFRFLFFLRQVLRLVLEAGPAVEKPLLAVLRHGHTRSLGCRKERGLMRFFGSGR